MSGLEPLDDPSDPFDPFDPSDSDVVGAVVDEGRGALPFALVHGESLVACASWALGAAGVHAVALGTTWPDVQEMVADAGTPFVLHDALCPLLDADEIVRCVRRAAAQDVVTVGVRPVTDTIKVVRDGLLAETLDRDELATVASPVVLPAWVVADLDHLPTIDFAALTAVLQARYPVELIQVPSSGRRVGSVEDVRVLEAATVRDADL